MLSLITDAEVAEAKKWGRPALLSDEEEQRMIKAAKKIMDKRGDGPIVVPSASDYFRSGDNRDGGTSTLRSAMAETAAHPAAKQAVEQAAGVAGAGSRVAGDRVEREPGGAGSRVERAAGGSRQACSRQRGGAGSRV